MKPKPRFLCENCSTAFLRLVLIMCLFILNGCGSSTSANSMPQAQVQPQTIPTIHIVPSKNPPEKQIISTEVIPQNNCGGTAAVTNEIERSRSIARTLDLGGNISIKGSGEADIPGVGNVQVGVEVAANYGVSYGSQEAVSRKLSVTAREGTNVNHTIQHIVYWETGEIIISDGSKEIARYPYRFRTDFGLELLESSAKNCEIPQTTPSSSTTQTAAIVDTREVVTPEADPVSPTVTTPTTISGSIPFESPNNPNTLNPVFGWQPGSSGASSYDLTLNPGVLTLIAGANTDVWQGDNSAPLIVYPSKGNFEVQVKIVFGPTANFQRAGLGVRSANDYNTWMSISRSNHSGAGGQANLVLANRQRTGLILNNSPYARDTVYLKIERRGSLFNLSYSESGSNWIVLQKDFVFELTDKVEVFIFVESPLNNQGTVAQFSDFIISEK